MYSIGRRLLHMATVITTSILSACYIASQPKFEAAVHRRVTLGMPLLTAVAALDMDCFGRNPIGCSRVRQYLFYSCEEKVSLHLSEPGDLVDGIKIHRIVCAGL